MATEFGKRIQGLIDKRKATRKTKGVVSGKSSGGGLSSAGAGGKGFAKGKRIKFGTEVKSQPATRFTSFVPSRSKSNKPLKQGTRTTSYGVVIPESAVSKGSGGAGTRYDSSFGATRRTGGGSKSFGRGGDTSSRSRSFGKARDTGGGKKSFGGK